MTAVEWLADYLVNAEQIDFWGAVEKARKMENEQIIQVAMYHKDSAVQRECVESYIANNFNQKQK